MSEIAKGASWDPESKPAPAAEVERGFFADLLHFAWENKIWWIAPAATILVLLGVMVFFAQGSSIAPFFYSLF
jgi:hypothetical protein